MGEILSKGYKPKLRNNLGYTLVEVVVVITVIGILTTIGYMGYNGWQRNLAITKIKSDLNGAASAMESAKNSSTGYPLTIPSSYIGSDDVIVAGGGNIDGTLFCIEAQSEVFSDINYYIYEEISNSGALEGHCTDRTYLVSCEDLDQYGTYPNCYDYDALPVATSISGYWAEAPRGYLLEDGRDVSCELYAELYDAMYSGTCVGVFALPDSQGKVAVNRDDRDASFNQILNTGGNESIGLSTLQIPNHTHSGTFATSSHTHNYSGNVDAIPSGQWVYHDNDDEEYVSYEGHVHGYSGTTGESNSTAGVTGEGGSQTHNEVQPSVVKNFAVKYTPASDNESRLPVATSIQGYWHGGYVDTLRDAGWLIEDGKDYSSSTYSSLYSAITTTYGSGNGTTTNFNVPDSRGRIAVNKSAIGVDTEFDSFTDYYGSKNVTINEQTMPTHNHQSSTFASSWHQHTYSGTTTNLYYPLAPAGTGWYDGDDNRPAASDWHVHSFSGTTDGNTTSSTVSYQGSGQSHNNLQPYIVKVFAIKHTAPSGDVDSLPAGTTMQGYWTIAPEGYVLENGQTVDCAVYRRLYEVLYPTGTCSGGFTVPDTRGHTIVNKKETGSIFSVIGNKVGEKYHRLTVGEMPWHNHIGNTFASSSHQHWMSFITGTPTDSDKHNNDDEEAGANLNHRHRFDNWSEGPVQKATIGSWGNNQVHDNIQPSIVQVMAIKF